MTPTPRDWHTVLYNASLPGQNALLCRKKQLSFVRCTKFQHVLMRIASQFRVLP